MTTMITEVYDALMSAGADDGKARRAAEVLADYEDRFDRIERRIGDLDHKVDEARIDLGARMELVESRLGGRITLLQWQLAVLIGGVTAVILKLFV